jgi:hypothetical protein
MWPMFESHVLVLDREYFGVSKIVDFYTVMNIADRFILDDSMQIWSNFVLLNGLIRLWFDCKAVETRLRVSCAKSQNLRAPIEFP